MGCAGSKEKDESIQVTQHKDADAPDAVQTSDITLKPAASSESMEGKKEKRRVGVSAETGTTSGEYKKVVHAKSDEQAARIAAATSKSALFEALGDAQRADVVSAMFEVEAKAGQLIIEQGDVGDNFYVVDSGTYDVLLKQKGTTPVHMYESGATFGELALMYNSPRAATIRCKDPGTLWALDRVTFRHIMMTANKESMNSKAQYLKAVNIFSPLTDEQREAISNILEETKFQAGDVIVKEGDPANSLMFVKSGECASFKKESGDKELFRMTTGQVIGESALEDGTTRQATVKAVGAVTMLVLTRSNFTELLGDLKDLLQQNFNEKVISSIDIFSNLTATERNTLVDSLKEEKFAANSVVVRQGDVGEDFFIIKSGEVKVTTTSSSGTEEVIKKSLGAGSYFGERAIVTSEPRMATVTALNDLVTMKLDRATFNSLVGSMKEILDRDMARREREAQKAMAPKILFEDLQPLTILGVGTFGRVKLVVHKPTQVPYALKCMRKGQVIALKQVEHVMNERRLLEMCDHPFLLALAATYQDADEIYMLLELALGGELFSVLRERGKFDEPWSRFYSACVASAFAYMHDLNVVYRDLKPENLLFDASGYLKVVDFGFAKQIEDRTWTLCGTPEYLAPEIIQNKGHNASVDWWAFGILIYEMLIGQPPFCADDPMDIYQKILRNKVSYPAALSKNVKDLIAKLLVTNSSQRLGSLKHKSRDITGHPFFKPIDWVSLYKKEPKAPYVPSIASPTDSSNFEQYEDEGGEDWARFNDRKKATFAGF